MRRPLRRGTPIDMARMTSWVSLFAGYRISVTEQRIDRWLDQFADSDRDAAARVLDCVDYFTHEQMASAFRSVLRGMDRWNMRQRERRGQWRFVAFSASAGESGDTMLHKFRLANGLGSRKHNQLFIYKSELLGQRLGPGDTVVFVDDFAGTGTQACNAWKDTLQELLPGRPRVFLVLVAASSAARRRIVADTEMMVAAHVELTEADEIFSTKCRHFSRREKHTILRYCRRADSASPRGFGDCGFVVVFAHNCPNNTIPILHARDPGGRRWEGLFRRHDV